MGASLPFEPEMILISAGPFLMGSTPEQVAAIDPPNMREWAEKTELPQRSLELPNFWIGKHPVTVGEYRVFIENGGYAEPKWWAETGWQWREDDNITQPDYWGNVLWAGNELLPVNGVSWYEASAYCRWLSETTGKSYHLPSEAEWEKAARGPDGRTYPWGNKWREGVCNIGEAHTGHTTPVGQFSPAGDSPYGVADMSGNVWEWCASKWIPQYIFPEDSAPEGDFYRVLRGGSWFFDKHYARLTCRLDYGPFLRNDLIGFRVVIAPSSIHSDHAV